MTDYKELELLVARIQQQLAPSAKVIHNASLPGRHSGVMRQIDVLVVDQVGQYEIKIAIDAKDHTRPVDVKGVEEFAGLVDDVGAQRGVLVSPKGFTETAKTRAKGFQMDIYSPVDTDPHKWKVHVTIPVVVDYREARISFGLSTSAPLPFMMKQGFFEDEIVYDESDTPLGTIVDTAIAKWNEGRFPIEPGEHEDLPIFESKATRVDNGYEAPLKARVPVTLYAGLQVERQLYYGPLPLTKVSGFWDHQIGRLITNAFTANIISPEEVERDWLKISAIEDAPLEPVFTIRGLVAWPE